jgi:hypothetical protein
MISLSRGSGGDDLGGESSAVLARCVHGDLGGSIMSTLASATGGDEVGAIKSNKLDAGIAVLGQEVGAVKADADLLVDEVRAEAVAEGSLDKQDVLSVEGGWSDLSVGGGGNTGCVNDFA